MEFPRCHLAHVTRNVYHLDKQNHRRQSCGRQFAESYSLKGYSEEVKRHCFTSYINGIEFRSIERCTKVNPNTMSNWARNAPPEAPADEEIPQPTQVDELQFWTADPAGILFGTASGSVFNTNLVTELDMTRIKGEYSRLRHYLAHICRKTFCYSKSLTMLRYSICLLLHYLKFGSVPLPR